MYEDLEQNREDGRIAGTLAVNTVVVYQIPEGEEYVETYQDGVPEIILKDKEYGHTYGYNNYLNGLHILKVDTSRNARLTTHPMENGQRVADNKVRDPTKITITAMCDNTRGEMDWTGKGEEPKTLLQEIGASAKSIAQRFTTGSDFEAHQTITTLAKRVYAKLEQMLTEKEKFTTYIVVTKGAVYQNMMLTGIDQLNEPEHLLTIPVTLRFEECILPGRDNAICSSTEDVALTMSGSKHENSILQDIGEAWNKTLSFLGID